MLVAQHFSRHVGEALREAVMCVERLIYTADCVAEGADWLASENARFAWAIKQTGPLPLRLREDGFEELLSAIVSQQVSVASAKAIWSRMQSASLTKSEKIIIASDEDLKGCGLSRQKMRYARALAEARIDYTGLRALPSDQVVQTLTKVIGVGVWTAEIYAMFSLGRADVFASGDLALQESTRLLFKLEARPTESSLRSMAQAWSPWRSVAARLLWAYYRVAKDREGIR